MYMSGTLNLFFFVCDVFVFSFTLETLTHRWTHCCHLLVKNRCASVNNICLEKWPRINNCDILQVCIISQYYMSWFESTSPKACGGNGILSVTVKVRGLQEGLRQEDSTLSSGTMGRVKEAWASKVDDLEFLILFCFYLGDLGLQSGTTTPDFIKQY